MGQIFDQAIAFDPNADLEIQLKAVPAKWAVYLFADEGGRPVQLLCVKNLRYSLKRRLSGHETVGPSKRVNYREIVRQVMWRRVDSAFEADWIYYEAARQLFPETYRGMVGFRPAWFVHVNPDAPFPRYVKTIDLSPRDGLLIGPVEDKHAAARLIELAQDAFDLCRYYNILVQAPHGKACAYKEMGKCPAPCDGSISMEQFRRMYEISAGTIVDPGAMIAEHKRRMQQAAGELRFELAAKIKAHVKQLSQLGQGPFRHARLLKDFRYVSIQRGPRGNTAKMFLITPGAIEEIAGLIGGPQMSDDLLRHVLERAEAGGVVNGVDPIGAERIGVVAQHLFAVKRAGGAFIHLDALDSRWLSKSFCELQKHKSDESGEEDEGVLKELQAL